LQLTTKHYYDDETFEHVLSKFYIDGEQVDFESYQDFIGGLEEYNKDEEDENNENPYEYEDQYSNCEKCNEFDNCLESGICTCKDDINEDNKILICDNDCENCEILDEICEEIGIIEDYASEIENNDLCEVCLRNLLKNLLDVGKEIGWDNCENELMEDENDEDTAIDEFVNKLKNYIDKRIEEIINNKDIYNLNINVNNIYDSKKDINTLASKIISGVKRL